MIKSKSDHQLRLSILDRLPTAILKDVLVDIVKQYELQHKLMEICQARCRACSGNRTQETVKPIRRNAAKNRKDDTRKDSQTSWQTVLTHDAMSRNRHEQ